jgi:hypothetical protein
MRRIWIGLLPTLTFEAKAPICVAQLQDGTNLSVVKLWLAGLLGGLGLEQRGGFYDAEGVSIVTY